MTRQVGVTERLAWAQGHHRAGRLGVAEALYRGILAEEPGHGEVLHVLGVLTQQLGRLDEAVTLLERAVTLRPEAVEPLVSLGHALLVSGRTRAAAEVFLRALTLAPDHLLARTNLGIAWLGLGEATQAEAAFRRVLEREPARAESHGDLGAALFHQGRLAEAEACYRQALALNPAEARMLNNLGNALLDQGRLAEAEAAYRQALAVCPDYDEALGNLGVALFAQDGSGVAGDCAAVVYSTAVEDQVPDIARARALGVPLVHRSELLAHFVAGRRTLAITGTSGKSTTVAMVFEILRAAGRDPSVITGGELVALQREGLWGNAWAGNSDLLVIEADESDGSVVRYRPAVGVILNLQRDHKEEAEVAAMFTAFRGRAREGFAVGEAANLAEFARGATVFGFGPGAGVRAEEVLAGPGESTFRIGATRFCLGVPGRHNVENALAAIAACLAVGVPLAAMAPPLERFLGVARRFQVLGAARGVEVVDDFGHNQAKVAASIRTAHLRAGRVLAVFQPHGFGPMRFLRQDFVAAFSAELHPEDRLWLLEIFYAGGTASQDLSSADVVADLVRAGVQAAFAPSREWLAATLAAEARAGDLILVMGARDPSLTGFAQDLLDRLAP